MTPAPVTLAGGSEIAPEVLALALRLESAGCPLVLDAARHLAPLRPGDIPAADRRAVARHWQDLAALVRYVSRLPADSGNSPAAVAA